MATNLQKKYKYTLAKKKKNAKLTCCNHFNKNVKHPNLKITKIWVKQK